MITSNEKKVAAWMLTMMLCLSMVFSQSIEVNATNGLAQESGNSEEDTMQEEHGQEMEPTSEYKSVMDLQYGDHYNDYDDHIELYIMSNVTRHVYTIGSGESVTIHCSGELEDFTSVQVDGVQVDVGNYILDKGSTILTFVSKYLDTLSVGTHKVTLNYTYDSVDTELTILGPAAAPVTEDITGTANGTPDIQENVSYTGNPIAVKTGDNTQVMFWVLAVVAALGSCVVLGYKGHSA